MYFIKKNFQQNKEDSQNINESPSPELSESEMVITFIIIEFQLLLQLYIPLWLHILFLLLKQHWRTLALDYAERFVGHCNTTTDIKEANFFGSDGNYVIAGYDDDIDIVCDHTSFNVYVFQF